MRALGLDIGDKRIGVALSDPLGLLASPLLVFEHKDETSDIDFILQLVKLREVGCIIVGFPWSMNGSIGPQAQKIGSFAEKLKQASPVPVELRDERLTTVAAMQLMQESGSKKTRKQKKVNYDAEAAALILQSYLNETKPIDYPDQPD